MSWGKLCTRNNNRYLTNIFQQQVSIWSTSFHLKTQIRKNNSKQNVQPQVSSVTIFLIDLWKMIVNGSCISKLQKYSILVKLKAYRTILAIKVGWTHDNSEKGIFWFKSIGYNKIFSYTTVFLRMGWSWKKLKIRSHAHKINRAEAQQISHLLTKV